MNTASVETSRFSVLEKTSLDDTNNYNNNHGDYFLTMSLRINTELMQNMHIIIIIIIIVFISSQDKKCISYVTWIKLYIYYNARLYLKTRLLI
jgi:hypothetical protein